MSPCPTPCGGEEAIADGKPYLTAGAVADTAKRLLMSITLSLFFTTNAM